jgi:hypothetical protein
LFSVSLIALREPDSKTPPLRGPSATVLPAKEPQSLTVLQGRVVFAPFVYPPLNDRDSFVEFGKLDELFAQTLNQQGRQAFRQVGQYLGHGLVWPMTGAISWKNGAS